MFRWNFLHSAKAIRKQEFSESLPKASVQDLGVVLMGAGYEVMLLYSFSFHHFLILFGFFEVLLKFIGHVVATVCIYLIVMSIQLSRLAYYQHKHQIGIVVT